MTNTTPDFSTNITSSEKTTTTAATTDATTDSGHNPNIIIGSTVGGTCAVVILVLLIILLCWRRQKRVKKKPGPTLPNPREIPAREPVRNDNELDTPDSTHRNSITDVRNLQVRVPSRDHLYLDISIDNSNRHQSPKHTWTVHPPVIHSPFSSSEEQQMTYMIMSEPSRRMTMSPPSPDRTFGNDNPFTDNRPPAVPTEDYTLFSHIPIKGPLSSPKGRGQSRSPGVEDATDVNELAADKNITGVYASGNKDYANIKDIIPAQKTLNRSGHITEVTNAQNFNMPDCHLPDLQINSEDYAYFNVNMTGNNALQNGTTNPFHMDDTIEEGSLDTQDNEGRPLSYVNVHNYQKILPVKKLSLDDMSRFASSKHISHDLKLEHITKTKPKQPATLPKPKPKQQKSPTQSCTSSKNLEADQDNSLSGRNDQSDRNINMVYFFRDDSNIDDSIYENDAKSLVENISPLPTPTKPHVPGTRSDLSNTGPHAKVKSHSDAYKDDVSVYQNSKVFSSSEPKLSTRPNMNSPQTEATNTHRKVSDTNPVLTKKMNKTIKTIDTNPTGTSQFTLAQTNFRSSPNVGSSETVLEEIKSKLKRIN